MPSFGQTTVEGTILDWLKQEGDPVRRGEPLADVETDKTTVQVEAFVSGYLRRIVQPAGSVVAAGEIIAILTSSPDEPIKDTTPPRLTAEAVPPAPVAARHTPRAAVRPVEPLRPAPARVLATPAARRLAEEHGLDLALVTGTGPGGRILEGDVRARLEQLPVQEGLSEITPADDPDLSAWLELSAVQRATAARMVRSVREAPQFALAVDVDMTEVERRRAQAGSDPKPSYTAFFVEAAAAALRLQPRLNASFEAERLRCYRDVNIGVAVATARGLLVPVIRQADRLSVAELSEAIAALRVQAEAGRLPAAAVGRSTFTVSNLGMYDIDRFTALLNPPEAGILAVGRVACKPVAVGSAVEVRPTATLTLTVDHRAADGASAAEFLSAVRRLLQEPSA
jgi:pyruvate dehydrogenase E2 component (dihydrolipoamide acetyltransferase)